MDQIQRQEPRAPEHEPQRIPIGCRRWRRMAEINDGTVKEVLEKPRRLSYKIEEVNLTFGTDRTGDNLEDLWVRVDYHENEMIN